MVTKRDVDRLLDMFVREHEITLVDILDEMEDGYVKVVSPVYQICRKFPGSPMPLPDLVGLVELPLEGERDDGNDICIRAWEVLRDPASAPLKAVRGLDGPLMCCAGGVPLRYLHSCLFRMWRSPGDRTTANQTPDFRILAEWILTLTSEA